MELFVYLVVVTIVLYSLDAVNYEKLLKKNKVFEARILYLLVAFALSYLVSEFILNFIKIAKFNA